jgi:hypothetical protein
VALVGLAVLLTGGGLPASAAPLPPPEKKSPFQPEEVRKAIPPGTSHQPGSAHPFAAVRASLRQALPPDQLIAAEQALDRFEQQAQNAPRPGQGPGAPSQQMQEMMERMRRQMGMPGMGGFGMSAAQSRLGASLRPPSPTLVDQLDLPKGEGLVIQGLQKGSAAAKAGVKENDILLELNGKKVPSDLGRFDELLRKIKADKKVDAVVLRKGKRETIEGLSLPEAKVAAGGPGMLGGPGGMQERMQQMMERMGRMPGGMPGMPSGMGGMPGGMGFGGGMGGMGAMMGGGGEGVLTTIHRRGDHFTTRYQEGSLVITLTGTVDKGKARLKEVHVQDAGSGHDYSSLEKVPERYQDKVKSLVEASEKGGGTGEVETPPAKGTKPQTRLRPSPGDGTKPPPAPTGKESKDK